MKYETKTEIEQGNDGSQMYAFYRWNPLLNSWMGLFKQEVYIQLDNDRIMNIYYWWNAPEQKWEASAKQIQELNDTFNGFTITEYVAQDSVIQDSIAIGTDP